MLSVDDLRGVRALVDCRTKILPDCGDMVVLDQDIGAIKIGATIVVKHRVNVFNQRQHVPTTAPGVCDRFTGPPYRQRPQTIVASASIFGMSQTGQSTKSRSTTPRPAQFPAVSDPRQSSRRRHL